MKRIKCAEGIFIAAAMVLSPLSFAAKADKVDVIVGYDGRPGQAETDRVKGLGGDLKREFQNFDMRAISISENALQALENGNGVTFVVADQPVESFSASAKQTARQPAPGSANAFPPDSSIGIAVLDTGVSAHGDLNVKLWIDCTEGTAACAPHNGALISAYRDEFTSTAYTAPMVISNGTVPGPRLVTAAA